MVRIFCALEKPVLVSEMFSAASRENKLKNLSNMVASVGRKMNLKNLNSMVASVGRDINVVIEKSKKTMKTSKSTDESGTASHDVKYPYNRKRCCDLIERGLISIFFCLGHHTPSRRSIETAAGGQG